MANSQTYLNSYRITDPRTGSFSIQSPQGSGGLNGAQYNNVTLSDGTSTGSTQTGENFNILGDTANDAVNNGANNGTSTYIGVGTINGIQGVIVYDPNGQGGGGYFLLTGSSLTAGTAGTAKLASATDSSTWWSLGGTTAPNAPSGIAFTDNVGSIQGSFTSGTRTDDASPTLTGTAGAGAAVKIYLNGATTPTATVYADASGKWNWTPSTPLAQGTYSYTATQTNTAGSTSAQSSAFTITVDTAAPTAPASINVSDNVAPGTGTVVNAGATNDTTPTISGTAEAGSTIKVFDGATQLGTTTVDANGNWSYTTAALSQGSHSITATATDAAGNVSTASTARTFTVDTAAPVAPSIVTVADDVAPGTGAVANAGATNDTTPTISGTGEVGATIQVFDGATQLGTTSVDASGNWSYTTAALSQGSHSITATATDAAGNVSAASTARTFTIDTTAPAAPTIDPLTTNDATPVLTGTATLGAGEALKVVVGGATYTVVPNGTGHWSLDLGTATPASGTLSLPADGTYAITATVTDAAGNATSGTKNLVLDTQPDTDVLVDITSTSDPAAVGFTVSGLDAGSTATVIFSIGTTTIGTANVTAANPSGTHDLSGYVGQSITATVNVLDQAGNGSGGAGETQVICFYPGTLIRTPDGEVAVETLKIGDLILNVEGKAMPVRWMGRQTVSTRFADPLRVLPIRIIAGALGENLPARDLLVSPDHALLIDGILVHAGALVNGTTVRRDGGVPTTFTYHHVELADHSLILAEGVPAETFVDNVDRMGFDNWSEHEALYGHEAAIAEMDLPRAKSHRQVPMAIRCHLETRAEGMFGKVSAAAA
ncbi:Ig-like domain-containing protein [Microvirga sp. 0TCS3.31]